MKLFTLIIACALSITFTSASAETKYVSSLVLMTGTATGGSSNTTINYNPASCVYITPPTATGIAALTSGTVSGNRLRNLSVRLTGGLMSTGNAPLSHRSYPINVSGEATIVISGVTFLDTGATACNTTSSTTFQIQYGSDAHTGLDANPGGGAVTDYWTQTFSATRGPKATITNTFMSLGSGGTGHDEAGTEASPNHRINVMASDATYTEDTDNTTLISSQDTVYLRPDSATPSTSTPNSWTVIEGYAAAQGDLLSSISSAVYAWDITTEANFPLIRTSDVNGSVQTWGGGTEDWGVSFKCCRISHASSTRVISANAVGGSLSFDACIIGDTSYAVATQRPFWDLTSSGLTKDFQFTRTELWGTGPCEFVCHDLCYFYRSQVRVRPASSSIYGIYWVGSTPATATCHTDRMIVDECDVELASTGPTAGNFANTVCIYPASTNFSKQFKVTNSRVMNRTRGNGILASCDGPRWGEITNNCLWSYNQYGGRNGIQLGADASVEFVGQDNFASSAYVPSAENLYKPRIIYLAAAGTSFLSTTNGAGTAYDSSETVTVTDALHTTANFYKGMTLQITNDAGRSSQRQITASSNVANVTTLTLNPSWTGTSSATGAKFSDNATHADGIAGPPPVFNVSEFMIFKDVPSKWTIRNNLSVQLRLPNNYVNNQHVLPYPDNSDATNCTYNATGLLIGQGIDYADISGNYIIGGDWGLVLKGEFNLLYNNVFVAGPDTCLIKGGSGNWLYNNTFITTTHNFGGQACLNFQDKSSFGSVTNGIPPLQQVYQSKSEGNTLIGNIFAVLPDGSSVVTGYDYQDATHLINGHNNGWLTEDNSIGQNTWSGDLDDFPMLAQSNVIDNNIYWHFDKADVTNQTIWKLGTDRFGDTAGTELTDLQNKWATADTTIQFPKNDAHSQYADPLFTSALQETLIDNFDDLSVVFTCSFASMTTDRDLMASLFELADNSPALRAGPNDTNIGAWQGVAFSDDDPRLISGHVTAVTIASTGVVTIDGLAGVDILASDDCDDGTTTITEDTVLATTDANGDFSWIQDPGDIACTIVPVLTGYTFTPSSYLIDRADSEPGIARTNIIFTSGSPATSTHLHPTTYSNGQLKDTNFTLYKSTASPAVTWTVLDASGNAIDCTGFALTWAVIKQDGTSLFTRTTAAGQITIATNAVSSTYTATNTATTNTYRYTLNRTDSGSERVLARGTVNIVPANR